MARIQVRVGVDFQEILDRKVVFGAFELHEVVRPEYPGDVLVDSQVGGLFNNEYIDPERFSGKLVFILELEGVFIVDKFQLEGLEKGGVPF
ncbi:MAG: hypothetical protein LBL56_00560 [Treponema sp.]|nr:hypothetical protein [Treponema sp.]